MSYFPTAVVLLCSLFTCVAAAAAQNTAEAPPGRAGDRDGQRPPNVVIVYIDDMGYGDLSVYGNPDVKTPNIDRMAAEGVRLTNYYTNTPICSPSRVAVMTGKNPERFAFYGHEAAREWNRRRRMADWLDPEATVLPRLMKDAGYATAHFGKWHMGGGRDIGNAPHPSAYGFDESLVSFEGLGERILPLPKRKNQTDSAALGGDFRWVEKSAMTGIYVDRAIDFIDRHQEEPFYLHLWPNDVHDPLFPSDADLDAVGDVGRNKDWQKYYAVLVAMDRQLGRLFDHIDELGLAENTLIIITSDNGPTAWNSYYKDTDDKLAAPGWTGGFRGRKWSLYEGGIRMPFITRWTGHTPKDKVNDTTVMAAVDLLPTLASICDIELPADYESDGENLADAMLGKADTVRGKPVFFEYNASGTNITDGLPHDKSPELAVRDGDWKLLMNPDGDRPELYNLADDPKESHDVSADQPAVVDRLKTTLQTWFTDATAEGEATRQRLGQTD